MQAIRAEHVGLPILDFSTHALLLFGMKKEIVFSNKGLWCSDFLALCHCQGRFQLFIEPKEEVLVNFHRSELIKLCIGENDIRRIISTVQVGCELDKLFSILICRHCCWKKKNMTNLYQHHNYYFCLHQ